MKPLWLAVAVRGLRRLLDAVAAALLAAILAVTAARVAGRYVLGLPLPWSEELTRLLFVWLIMLGAARAAHMRIELLQAALAPRMRRTLGIAVAGLCTALLALLVYYGLALVELTAYDRYTALGVSVQYLYWAVVIGGAAWIALLLADTFLGSEERPPSAP